MKGTRRNYNVLLVIFIRMIQKQLVQDFEKLVNHKIEQFFMTVYLLLHDKTVLLVFMNFLSNYAHFPRLAHTYTSATQLGFIFYFSIPGPLIRSQFWDHTEID